MAYVNGIHRRQGVYCGQHKTRDDYPLLSSHYNYTVNDCSVMCKLTESYHVKSKVGRQVSYLFEVPPEASVVRFEAKVGSIQVKAIVEEKGEANNKYQQAVVAGTQGWKLDKVNDEVFSIDLGNAVQNSLITVYVYYLHLISSDTLEDSLRLTVRAGLAPRLGGAPGGIISAPTASVGEDAVTITVGINSVVKGSKILNLQCISHPADTSITLGFSDTSFEKMTVAQQAQAHDIRKAYVKFTSQKFFYSNFVLVWNVLYIDYAWCSVKRLD
ncbi:hypothetical protein F5Y12DRAFT_717099 [Xylaria sp. FL1777]|nr:hypothetical protein F5Y12DRAFT_717099 [Xylaria sp. FL1777]